MIHKDKRYRRMQRRRAITRKKRICHRHQEQYAEFDPNGSVILTDRTRKMPFDYYLVDGKYNKGKIHCGCGLCKPTKQYGYASEKQIREEKRHPIEDIDG